MSGDTDCYQPAEKQFKITRQCLEVFLRYKHPIGIITKNTLILRDLDIIKALAKEKLIALNVSITSLFEDMCRILEPRTTIIKLIGNLKNFKFNRTIFGRTYFGIEING